MYQTEWSAGSVSHPGFFKKRGLQHRQLVRESTGRARGPLAVMCCPYGTNFKSSPTPLPSRYQRLLLLPRLPPQLYNHGAASRHYNAKWDHNIPVSPNLLSSQNSRKWLPSHFCLPGLAQVRLAGASWSTWLPATRESAKCVFALPSPCDQEST